MRAVRLLVDGFSANIGLYVGWRKTLAATIGANTISLCVCVVTDRQTIGANFSADPGICDGIKRNLHSGGGVNEILGGL